MAVQTLFKKESAESRLARHGGLCEARQKLAELEAGWAAVEAGIDRNKAALSDTNKISDKLMNGDPIELGDTFNSEAEASKLAGYAIAIAKQKNAIEQELRAASKDVCDIEAPAYRVQIEKLSEQANQLISTFHGMECRVAELRNAGVLLSNDFPLFDKHRFRTILFQVKNIADQYDRFVK